MCCPSRRSAQWWRARAAGGLAQNAQCMLSAKQHPTPRGHSEPTAARGPRQALVAVVMHTLLREVGVQAREMMPL